MPEPEPEDGEITQPIPPEVAAFVAAAQETATIIALKEVKDALEKLRTEPSITSKMFFWVVETVGRLISWGGEIGRAPILPGRIDTRADVVLLFVIGGVGIFGRDFISTLIAGVVSSATAWLAGKLAIMATAPPH